jgi:hypothetical protein
MLGQIWFMWGLFSVLINVIFWVFNTTFSYISAISWWPVLVVERSRSTWRTTHHGQVTGKLYHLWLRVECILFCKLQSRARTHTILVIDLYELLQNVVVKTNNNNNFFFLNVGTNLIHVGTIFSFDKCEGDLTRYLTATCFMSPFLEAIIVYCQMSNYSF